MATINAAAQKVIDRLAALNYDEPNFNLEKITESFERQYKLLGIDMPKIEVADNMVMGFELAWGAARDAAWDAAWGAAWDAARDAAWGAARDAARDAAWGAARGAARDAAWGAARDAAWGAAWGAARDAARDAAWGAAALNTGLTDAGTLKWIEISTEELKALENGLGFFFPMKDKLILVPVPRMIMIGDRLHYDQGKAVEWADGTGFYFLRGVKFDDEKLYWKIVKREITGGEALGIINSDQRMAAISMLRPDRLLRQLGAELVHTGIKGTKLYEIKNFMGTNDTEYAMWMQDSSSPREFIEFVPPEVGKQKDADFCQASAWGIPLEDYLGMEAEA